jgi:hypothetical protein
MQASSLPCMSWKKSWRPRGEGRAAHHGLDPVEVQRPMGRFNDIANRVKSDRVGWGTRFAKLTQVSICRTLALLALVKFANCVDSRSE